ncbi:MAG: hypothetical protein RMJ98_10395 [Myxococcales bacterium]|nr:hypothetical protein [Polyangiaceae bacterium]MDW8249695.1 hypothetical protein [Myxococcales bacterium]
MTRQVALLLMTSSFVACDLSGLSAITITPGERPPPQGPVATNAAEAFPQAPEGVPVLKPQDIFSACVKAAECELELPAEDAWARSKEEAHSFVDICTLAMAFSAERAIPVSGFFNLDATADKWVDCVQRGTTCGAINACSKKRELISCEEAGCTLSAVWKETKCEGSVATILTSEGTVTRDCSLAHATCDTQSKTGCTDRPYSACPADMDRADRCEGDIRLGCDGFDQVSYRDCSRMGGTCGMTSEGKMDCIYPAKEGFCKKNGDSFASCEGSELVACFLGQEVKATTKLCPVP